MTMQALPTLLPVGAVTSLYGKSAGTQRLEQGV